MRRHSKTPRNYVALIATAGLLLPFTGSAQVSVLTANYDNARTNANLEETILTPASVNPRSFGKIGAFPVDGQIYAQPLYIAGLNVPGQGQRDVVFVVTMNNTVYAIDAHAPQPTVALWQASLGDALPSSVISLNDIDPSIGILSTPVIDPAGNVIYVVAETLENNQPVFRLHALDLSDGHETMNGPVEIQATVPGIGDASQNGQIAFDPFQHLQRPGLLLLNGAVYVAFASHHDMSPYHGWIMSYDASNLQNQLAVLNTTPNGGGGGIWQSGRSLAADANGNIFVATGNGDYDGVLNFGECFLRLSQNLSVLDWFAPSDWLALSDNDYDLGALGPVLVPGSSLLVGGDKAGNFYVADSANLGHLGTSGAALPQITQPIAYGGFFNIALWNQDQGPFLYMIDQSTETEALRITNGLLEAQPFSITSVTSDYPFQGMAVSANGGADGTGIFWMTAGDHSAPGVPGTLYAFNASDLTQLLWSSEMNARRDRLGGFAKFANPTVANGRVFVSTFSNELVIYGPLEFGGPRPVRLH
ncbi:MAG: hypothetical protein ABSB86_08445 [Bryobacteraceae bacterium]|jgi:hypothetical protein